jgi:hypothetical protein
MRDGKLWTFGAFQFHQQLLSAGLSLHLHGVSEEQQPEEEDDSDEDEKEETVPTTAKIAAARDAVATLVANIENQVHILLRTRPCV